jgi:hypothetical protein
MPKGMVPIYTQTVATTGGVNISFVNIPQNYTDLMFVGSLRFDGNGGDSYITFNNDSSAVASGTYLQSTSGGPYSGRMTANWGAFIGQVSGATETASTFSNVQIHIPNYSSNIFKTTIGNACKETNSTTTFTVMPTAGLWRSNAPITSLYFYGLAQHSSATLYGISK